MKHFAKALRSKSVRTSTQTSLDASGAVPNSRIDSLATSQGASRALSELSHNLEPVLEKIDLEGDISAQLKAELARLDAKVASFTTSSVHACPSIERWKVTRANAVLIGLAWDCAARVYDSTASPISDGYDFHIQSTIPSSRNGDIKETTFTIVTEKSREASTNLLVVAVRGSAGTIDHIVNLHGEAKDANALLNDVAGPPLPESLFNAHAGFLNCALQIRQQASGQINEYLLKNPERHVLFTGHSAGGAVASLLALTFNSEADKQVLEAWPVARFSCITFGSPPVAKFSGSPSPRLRPDPDVTVINIINEFDFVSRAEQTYIRSLIDIYDLINAEDAYVKEKDEKRAVWSLPPPILEHIGRIVVFTKEVPDLTNGDNIETTNPVSVWNVPRDEFSTLLFCKFSVHKRTCYRDRINELIKGNINGMSGWP